MHPVVTRGSEELSLVRPQVPLLSILTLIKFPASIYVGMQVRYSLKVKIWTSKRNTIFN
jgi:hypothetical protein